uniref:Uncharacterized protein n=1 Tax=Arundo donax TaxID=35708 RepID=A0A0A9AGB0_ARUDO
MRRGACSRSCWQRGSRRGTA